MATLKLKDFNVEKLSDETLDIISELTTEIKKLSGKSFRFNDPFLLPRIHSRVRKLNNPQTTMLYKKLKRALIENVVDTKGAALMTEAERQSRLDFSQLRSIKRKTIKPKNKKVGRGFPGLEVSFMSM